MRERRVPVIITQPTAYTLSGQVTLTSAATTTFSRAVTFVCSQVVGGTTNYLQTNTITLSFTSRAGSYSFSVPTATTAVSAKTAWTLRKNSGPITFVAGAATVNLTQAGGDISGNNNLISNWNDLNALKLNYNKTTAADDITGDGVVNLNDLNILKLNYNKTGDPM